jgi:hypothetical protein
MWIPEKKVKMAPRRNENITVALIIVTFIIELVDKYKIK